MHLLPSQRGMACSWNAMAVDGAFCICRRAALGEVGLAGQAGPGAAGFLQQAQSLLSWVKLCVHH